VTAPQGAAGPGLAARALGGAAWQTASISIQAVLQVVVLAVLARHVTPREFGLVAVAQMFTGILQLAAEGGFWASVVQLPVLTRRHLKAIYGMSALFSVALVGVAWAVAPFFAAFFHAEELTLLLRVMSLYVVLTGWGLVSRARLERELDFRSLFRVDMASFMVGYVAVAIGGALLGWGVWALAGAILGRAACFALLVSLVRAPVYGVGFGRAELRDVFGFGVGFTLGRLLDYFAWQADYLVVARLQGVSLLGVYQRGYELMELPGRFLGKIADKVLFASMAQLQSRREALAAAFLRSVEISSLLVLPLAVWMALTAPEIVRLLYGEKWMAVVPLLQILLLTPLFRTSGRVAEALSRAAGVVYRNAWRKGLSVATVAGGAWIGQHWGLTGVAWGAGAAVIFNSLMLLHLALRTSGAGWGALARSFLPAVWLSAAGAAAAAPATLGLRALHAPAVVVLAASALAGGAAVLATMRLRPALFGQAAPWLLERGSGNPAVARLRRWLVPARKTLDPVPG
jgi:O-antigen/teichoic acid export membrane protein